MGNPHGPNLWETALHKLFYKRASQKKDLPTNLPLEPGTEISEHTDGFYMYSQSLLEEEARKVEAMNGDRHEKHRSDGSETSFASAVVSRARSI